MSQSSLIAILAAAFVVAFAIGFLAVKLRMPPLVGYLIAGVLIGPHTPGFVADGALARELSEVGVILLMFGVGLHFSVKDLLAVRRIALPGALAQVLSVTLIGSVVAVSWGWPGRAAGVFGLSLSIASTIVLLRALEERRELFTPEGRIAVGWLIVQDIIAVLSLVLLPVVASTSAQGAPSAALTYAASFIPVAVTIGKIAVFVSLALLVGKRVVPWMLMQAVRTGSRELFTLAVLAVALGIAWGSAALFGVSLALGAFFAGVILSESPLSHKAGEDSLPLQDAFAVLFFVSVGMLFDPNIIVHEPLKLALVLLLIFIANPVVAFALMIIMRYPLRSALRVSASLSQTGEFSFILAGLGAALGILPPSARDLILAGSILSIIAYPLSLSAVSAIHRGLMSQPQLMRWLDRSPPPRLETAGEPPVLRNHVVVVGHGRVGRALAPALALEGLPLVVIERERGRCEDLKRLAIPCVFGDATSPGVLDTAQIRSARVLVVALPDSFQVRRVLEMALELNPNLDTVARTHSEAEWKYLHAQGVKWIVMGERAIARSMAEYVLRGAGVAPARALQLAQDVDPSGERTVR